MLGSGHYYDIFFKLKAASTGLMLLVLGMVIVSCDDVERYEIVKFFFDGVPPLEQESLEEELANFNSQDLTQKSPETVWYVHEPRRACMICHGKRRQSGFSSQTYLTSPVPELCYDCHEDYTGSASFVHGPVAVGQCLFCHNPHKSKIKYLLNEPVPKLCYLCHDINAIELIPAHLTQQWSECMNCHSAHESSVKALLKEDYVQSNEELNGVKEVDTVVQEYIKLSKGNDANELKRGGRKRAIEHERESLFQVLGEVSKLIEQGELQKARAYLTEFKESKAFTDEERVRIINVLRLLDTAMARAGLNYDTAEQKSFLNKQNPKKAEKEPGESNNEYKKQNPGIVDLYYRSMELYRSGRLIRAREGFVKVLKSGLIPAPMAKTIRGYLLEIDNTLSKTTTSPNAEK